MSQYLKPQLKSIPSPNPDAYVLELHHEVNNTVKRTGIVVYLAPTNNCQIYSIAGIHGILCQENALEILKSIQDRVQKSQLLIDICSHESDDIDDEVDWDDEENYCKIVEKLFKPDDIIFKQEYRNNTGSAMVMYLLQTENLN